MKYEFFLAEKNGPISFKIAKVFHPGKKQ